MAYARRQGKAPERVRYGKKHTPERRRTGIYKTWKLAAHPGGTVRIGHMLDSNLKLKGYENLYVCDCSVIPEPFGLPPVLTLVCLGKRLAKHLTGEKKSLPQKKAKTGKR